MIKKVLKYLGLLAILAVGYLFYTNYPKLEVVSSYANKKMCSCLFIDGRPQSQIENDDLGKSPFNLAKHTVNTTYKTVTTSILGMHTKTSEYRDGLGCVLIHGKDDYKIEYPKKSLKNDKKLDISFPYGHKFPSEKPKGIDYDKLEKVIPFAFDENDAVTEKKTRALLVLHKDSIILEHYANGYSKNSEMLGWSMTKSIMNAWTGMMVMDGKTQITNKGLFPEWTDNRKDISLKHLLTMTSGLEWKEDYASISSATKMLFTSEDIVGVAKNVPQEFPPGTSWKYSSGTSNLIAGYLRTLYASHDDYLRYPRERIFEKLGMNSMVMEVDESGNYIGSSYSYATARDWARFGTLYLHDGMWNGERLLPEGWVDFSREVVPESDGLYGAQFWTNGNHAFSDKAPLDTYSMNGFEGQRIFIIPSEDIIIVRLGLARIDFGELVRLILDAKKK